MTEITRSNNSCVQISGSSKKSNRRLYGCEPRNVSEIASKALAPCASHQRRASPRPSFQSPEHQHILICCEEFLASRVRDDFRRQEITPHLLLTRANQDTSLFWSQGEPPGL